MEMAAHLFLFYQFFYVRCPFVRLFEAISGTTCQEATQVAADWESRLNSQTLPMKRNVANKEKR